MISVVPDTVSSLAGPMEERQICPSILSFMLFASVCANCELKSLPRFATPV